MSTALRPIFLALVCALVVSSAAFAYAQDDSSDDANDACSDLPHYFYEKDGPKERDGKANLYGKQCLKMGESGGTNVLVRGICVAAKSCQGQEYYGLDKKWHPVPAETQTKPSGALPRIPGDQTLGGLTDGMPVSPSVETASQQNTELNRLLFDPTSVSKDTNTIAPSAKSVEEQLSTAEKKPGILDSIRSYFFGTEPAAQQAAEPQGGALDLRPGLSAENAATLEGGAIGGLEQQTVETSRESGGFAGDTTFETYRPAGPEDATTCDWWCKTVDKSKSFFSSAWDAVTPGSAEAKPSEDTIKKAAEGKTFTGDASYYDPTRPGFKSGGMGLSTGGIYNPNAYEAALQLDIAERTKCGYGAGNTCFARIDYGDKSLIVKINDNGPLYGDRIVDLNRKSMEHFGDQRGVLKGVKVTLLEGSDYTPGPVGPSAGGSVPLPQSRPAAADAADIPLPRERPANVGYAWNPVSPQGGLSGGFIGQNDEDIMLADASRSASTFSAPWHGAIEYPSSDELREDVRTPLPQENPLRLAEANVPVPDTTAVSSDEITRQVNEAAERDALNFAAEYPAGEQGLRWDVIKEDVLDESRRSAAVIPDYQPDLLPEAVSALEPNPSGKVVQGPDLAEAQPEEKGYFSSIRERVSSWFGGNDVPGDAPGTMAGLEPPVAGNAPEPSEPTRQDIPYSPPRLTTAELLGIPEPLPASRSGSVERSDLPAIDTSLDDASIEYPAGDVLRDDVRDAARDLQQTPEQFPGLSDGPMPDGSLVGGERPLRSQGEVDAFVLSQQEKTMMTLYERRDQIERQLARYGVDFDPGALGPDTPDPRAVLRESLRDVDERILASQSAYEDYVEGRDGAVKQAAERYRALAGDGGASSVLESAKEAGEGWKKQFTGAWDIYTNNFAELRTEVDAAMRGVRFEPGKLVDLTAKTALGFGNVAVQSVAGLTGFITTETATAVQNWGNFSGAVGFEQDPETEVAKALDPIGTQVQLAKDAAVIGTTFTIPGAFVVRSEGALFGALSKGAGEIFETGAGSVAKGLGSAADDLGRVGTIIDREPPIGSTLPDTPRPLADAGAVADTPSVPTRVEPTFEPPAAAVEPRPASIADDATRSAPEPTRSAPAQEMPEAILIEEPPIQGPLAPTPEERLANFRAAQAEQEARAAAIQKENPAPTPFEATDDAIEQFRRAAAEDAAARARIAAETPLPPERPQQSIAEMWDQVDTRLAQRRAEQLADETPPTTEPTVEPALVEKPIEPQPQAEPRPTLTERIRSMLSRESTPEPVIAREPVPQPPARMADEVTTPAETAPEVRSPVEQQVEPVPDSTTFAAEPSTPPPTDTRSTLQKIREAVFGKREPAPEPEAPRIPNGAVVEVDATGEARVIVRERALPEEAAPESTGISMEKPSVSRPEVVPTEEPPIIDAAVLESRTAPLRSEPPVVNRSGAISADDAQELGTIIYRENPEIRAIEQVQSKAFTRDEAKGFVERIAKSYEERTGIKTTFVDDAEPVTGDAAYSPAKPNSLSPVRREGYELVTDDMRYGSYDKDAKTIYIRDAIFEKPQQAVDEMRRQIAETAILNKYGGKTDIPFVEGAAGSRSRISAADVIGRDFKPDFVPEETIRAADRIVGDTNVSRSIGPLAEPERVTSMLSAWRSSTIVKAITGQASIIGAWLFGPNVGAPEGDMVPPQSLEVPDSALHPIPDAPALSDAEIAARIPTPDIQLPTGQEIEAQIRRDMERATPAPAAPSSPVDALSGEPPKAPASESKYSWYDPRGWFGGGGSKTETPEKKPEVETPKKETQAPAAPKQVPPKADQVPADGLPKLTLDGVRKTLGLPPATPTREDPRQRPETPDPRSDCYMSLTPIIIRNECMSTGQSGFGSALSQFSRGLTRSLTANQQSPSTATQPSQPARPADTSTVAKPKPTVAIVANPTTIKSGTSTRLTWASVVSDSCVIAAPTISFLASTTPSGSTTTPALASTTVFAITCSGTSGTASGEVRILVQ